MLEPLIFTFGEEFSLDLPFIDVGQVPLNNPGHYTKNVMEHTTAPLPNLSKSTIIHHSYQYEICSLESSLSLLFYHAASFLNYINNLINAKNIQTLRLSQFIW